MVKNKKQEVKIKVEENKVNEEALLLKSQLARTLADYDNLVKRIEREREDIKKVVSLGIILKLLSVLDGLEMAQDHLKDAGLAISIGEFKKVLQEEGLIEIRPEAGSEFNEEEMEVIEVENGEEDNDGSSAKIVGTSLVGWKFKDGTVVRHAKVKVIKK